MLKRKIKPRSVTTKGFPALPEKLEISPTCHKVQISSSWSEYDDLEDDPQEIELRVTFTDSDGDADTILGRLSKKELKQIISHLQKIEKVMP